MSRRAIKHLCLAGSALILLYVALRVFSRPESGVGLASVDWLDSRASDISFYRANDISGNFVYEFRISREDFAALARERGWQLEPLTQSRGITRYTFFLLENDSRAQKPTSVELDSGLFYERRHPNGGGITVLYDTNASKAYVSRSSR